MHGITLSMLDHLLIPGFLTGEKIFKNLFQIGFRNSGYFLVPIQIFYVLKSANLDPLKQISQLSREKNDLIEQVNSLKSKMEDTQNELEQVKKTV